MSSASLPLSVPRLSVAQCFWFALLHVSMLIVAALGACAPIRVIAPPPPIAAHVPEPARGVAPRSLAPLDDAAKSPQGDTAPDQQTLFAVLSLGSRVFAITGPTASARPGSLSIAEGAELPARPVTLVGRDGTCVATTLRHATVVSPASSFTAFELGGCSQLAAAATGVLVGVAGAHPEARWLVPDAGPTRELPPDRELGERAVRLQSYSLPAPGARLVERVTERQGATCDDELHDLILIDDSGHPLERYADFDLAGGVALGDRTLLVLVGWLDPEALRVVELDGAATRVALDARLAVFEDAGHEC